VYEQICKFLGAFVHHTAKTASDPTQAKLRIDQTKIMEYVRTFSMIPGTTFTLVPLPVPGASNEYLSTGQRGENAQLFVQIGKGLGRHWIKSVVYRAHVDMCPSLLLLSLLLLRNTSTSSSTKTVRSRSKQQRAGVQRKLNQCLQLQQQKEQSMRAAVNAENLSQTDFAQNGLRNVQSEGTFITLIVFRLATTLPVRHTQGSTPFCGFRPVFAA
jgi:hypothetical protein